MPLPPIPVPNRVLRGVLAARSRVFGLADRMLPAEAALWDFAAGMQRTKLAGALVESGIADALAQRPRDGRELARDLGLSEDVTLRVLGAAAASRLVRLDRAGKASLARIGKPLAKAYPHSMSAWVAYQAAPANAAAHGELAGQLLDGAEPSGHRRAFGNSVWDHFAEHTDEGARFGEAMRELTAIDLGALARAYPWPREGVVCDMAGGIGTLLVAILRRRPNARGVLVDASEVLAEAEPFLHSQGVADRVQRRAGDLFGELDAQADVYVLKWILHDWSDEACLRILRSLRSCMPPGSRVVAIDQHLEPGRPNPVTSMVDLLMLVECEGGRERSPGEVHELMRAADIAPGRVRHAGAHMLVEGIAAERRPPILDGVCGRYTNTAGIEELNERFGVPIGDGAGTRRYNIAPTEDVLALVHPRERVEARLLRWGLVPSWSTDLKSGYKTINARLETVTTMPAYRNLIGRGQRRALQIADGWFEWIKPEKPKEPRQPFYFQVDGGLSFAFAALWTPAKIAGEWVSSCALLTCAAAPNRVASAIHGRMPVVLADREAQTAWLDPRLDAREALSLCAALPEARLSARPANPAVNKVVEGVEGPELLSLPG